MGGYGSGRRGGRATTANYWQIDVRRMQRGGFLRLGSYSVWKWSRNGEVPGFNQRKGSVGRNIPLTPRTREMLLARKQSGEKSRFVFPGPGTSGHLTTIQHAHERTIRDAGIKPFEFYCWRHTFGTRCAESG